MELRNKEDKDKQEVFNSLFRCDGKDYYFSKKIGNIDSYTQRIRLRRMIANDFPMFKMDGKLSLSDSYLDKALATNHFRTIKYYTDLFEKKRVKKELFNDKLIITKNYFDFSCKEPSLTLPQDELESVIEDNIFLLDNIIEEMYKKNILERIPLSSIIVNNLFDITKKYIQEQKDEITKGVIKGDISQYDLDDKSISKIVNNFIKLNEIIEDKKFNHLIFSKEKENKIKNGKSKEEGDLLIKEEKQALYDNIVKSYNIFFPQFEIILEWIVACRFTYNRRTSFLHLRANAGFGKSFFKNIFAYINLLTECRYEDFKSPSSLESGFFKDKLLLVIDEFTIFKKDFKNLTNTMLLDAKYQLRQEIDIYAKIFLSAEQSNSFDGGADRQIKDRVNVIDINSKKLEQLKLFKEYTSSVYMEYLGYYTYNKIIELFDKYKMMGKQDSGAYAENVLSIFHSKYKLKTDDLEIKIKEYYIKTIYELFISKLNDINNKEEDIYNRLYLNEKGVYIKQPKSTMEKILLLSDENFYKKSRYKLNQLNDIFESEVKNRKILGKSFLTFFIDKKFFIELYSENEYNDLIETNFE